MAKRDKTQSLSTRLIHAKKNDGAGFEALSMPTYRGSTTVFASVADMDTPYTGQYRYGLSGTPTQRELSARLAEIEGANDVILTPSGLAAISLTLLAFAKTGGHMLFPASAYYPTLSFAEGKLRELGVEIEVYEPTIGGGIAELIRDNSLLIWTESPGSITMEVQDIPAISAAAHARDVPVAIDNTYGAGVLFDAFAAGVDISVQALTKYQGGHSDVLMGSVASRDPAIAAKIARANYLLGLGVSPDDCQLVLRGLKTLDLRLSHMGESALNVAKWLQARPEVTAVLHPALPDCAGHNIWKRDWTGSASIFSIIFGDWTRDQVVRFVDALTLFPIGFSWGGAHSLACTYKDLTRPTPETGPLLVRLNIGLEDPSDLINDLEQALDQASSR